ncbi:MAG TPA: hypothetical protein VM344_11385 [Vitreimonas sp.]|nr:hypothetical protein [Vitreimonas sp.]
MDAEHRPIPVSRQRISDATVRLRVPDAVPDESLFFVLALLAGGVCGYLAAMV